MKISLIVLFLLICWMGIEWGKHVTFCEKNPTNKECVGRIFEN